MEGRIASEKEKKTKGQMCSVRIQKGQKNDGFFSYKANKYNGKSKTQKKEGKRLMLDDP